jgi:hypothetical protein
MKCESCGKILDPEKDVIVRLTVVMEENVLRWTANLCAPTPDQMKTSTPSPCVKEFRERWGRTHDIIPFHDLR